MCCQTKECHRISSPAASQEMLRQHKKEVMADAGTDKEVKLLTLLTSTDSNISILVTH